MSERQQPQISEFIKTPLQETGEKFSSWSSLNEPHQLPLPEVTDSRQLPLPEPMQLGKEYALTERRLEVDDENPYGSEFRGPGLDLDRLDRI